MRLTEFYAVLKVENRFGTGFSALRYFEWVL